MKHLKNVLFNFWVCRAESYPKRNHSLIISLSSGNTGLLILSSMCTYHIHITCLFYKKMESFQSYWTLVSIFKSSVRSVLSRMAPPILYMELSSVFKTIKTTKTQKSFIALYAVLICISRWHHASKRVSIHSCTTFPFIFLGIK